LKAAVVVIAAAGLALACGGPPESVVVDIGVHRVSFIIPEGWQHYHHGREHRLETGDGDLVLTDLGPVAADGYRSVILEARDLTRRGQREEANQLLNGLAEGRAVDDDALRVDLETCLEAVRSDRPPATTEAAFASLLDRLDGLPEPDLAALASVALADLGHGPRRDIERRERLILDGREAHRILTWQRLTHDGRLRHVFVVNRGNLLVIRTAMGRDEVLGPAFDTVVRSLVFFEPEAQSTR
jgi:hypothetical protein